MNIVIIGAGQTGRGFIAPLMKKNAAEITFIDKNRHLVAELKRKGRYNVSYFDDRQTPLEIKDFSAYDIGQEEVYPIIGEADIVTVSVFADNIPELVPVFRKSLQYRVKPEKLIIICIENGINVKRPLVEAGIDALVTEGIIFCTSVADRDGLDITSESYPDIPIDGAVDELVLDLPGFPRNNNFKQLIQRKIYTYNFISALIAYLGSYAGISSYGTAANDYRIRMVIKEVTGSLNVLIADRFAVSLEEQTLFSEYAIRKFQNVHIADSIERNAQQVMRKLGSEERLVFPLKLAIAHQQNTVFFDLVVAAALRYGKEYEHLNINEAFSYLEEMIDSAYDLTLIRSIYAKLTRHEALEEIINNLGRKEV